jgi:hypothetical protein
MSLTHVDPHVSEIVMVWIQSGDLLMVWIQIFLFGLFGFPVWCCSRKEYLGRLERGDSVILFFEF